MPQRRRVAAREKEAPLWERRTELHSRLQALCFSPGPGWPQVAPVLPTPERVPAVVGGAAAVEPDAYGTSATTVVKIHGTAFRSNCSGDTLNAYWDTGVTYRSGGNIDCML